MSQLIAIRLEVLGTLLAPFLSLEEGSVIPLEFVPWRTSPARPEANQSCALRRYYHDSL